MRYGHLVLVAGILMPGCGQDVESVKLEGKGMIDLEDGARLEYQVVGQGPPLVVLHGGPGLSYGYLYPQLTTLLSDELQLAFYNQRGSGHSTGSGDDSRLTMSQFVADLEAVRQSLGLERMRLLGHSFGGLLAMFYATTHPDRVEKLMLVDSDAASWELRTPYQRETINARLTEQDHADLAAIEAMEGWENSPELRAAYTKVYLRTYFGDRDFAQALVLEFDDVSLHNYRITSAALRRDLGSYDIHKQLSRITSPTLLIHGDSSIFSVEGAVAIHERIAGSELAILEGVGHFPYIEAPGQFARLVKSFLLEKEKGP